MAAILSGEPWCLTPAEIGKLTLVQVQELFFRPRDKSGNIRRDPDKIGVTLDPREDFIRVWRKWGLTRERAGDLWRDKIQQERLERKARESRGRKKKA